MRKIYFVITMVMAFTSADAQYKKASFLNKTGRIYDAGATYRIQSGERSSSAGFFLSYGKEKSSQRLHHWFDLEFNLGNKYNYTTTASGGGANVQLSGKTKNSLSYRYNLAFFLLDNGDEEKKILPFIHLSAGYQFPFLTGDYTTTPEDVSVDRYPEGINSNFHYGGGAGVLYRITPAIGIRASVTYYGLTDTAEPTEFSTLVNHPAVSVGVRFRMDRDDD